MPIVFRFNSMDSRERATLVIDTPEAAAKHVTKVLNAGRRSGSDLWTLDEEGEEVPSSSDVVACLRNSFELKLYGQRDRHTDNVVTIEKTFVIV